MRLVFRATEGGFTDQGDPTNCLICGVSGQDEAGAEHYLILQRGPDEADHSGDDGVHCEFDDPIHGAYNCVAHCRATRDVLDVTLTRPIDQEKKYHGVSVDLSGLDLPSVEEIRAGLPRIFRGMRGILQIA